MSFVAISQNHDHNERLLRAYIKDHAKLDMSKLEQFLEIALHNEEERLTLLRPVLPEREAERQETLQCQAVMALAHLRIRNRFHAE
jgi:hypothetical protein